MTCQFLAPVIRQKLKEVEDKIEVLQQQKSHLLEALSVVNKCDGASETEKDFVVYLNSLPTNGLLNIL